MTTYWNEDVPTCIYLCQQVTQRYLGDNIKEDKVLSSVRNVIAKYQFSIVNILELTLCYKMSSILENSEAKDCLSSLEPLKAY